LRAFGPDELLVEQCYLVERGVRAVALVGSCEPDETATCLHALACVAGGRVVPFVVGDGAWCGFAANAWAVDLLRWLHVSVPRVQVDRVLGVLLGYAPAAIARFEELGVSLHGSTSRDGDHDGPVRPEAALPEVREQR
jgi:hypothetical protein